MKKQSRNLLISCCVLPWLATLSPLRQDDPSKWTTSQWVTWRDGQIAHILEPTFDAGGEKLLSRDEVIERSAKAFEFLSPYLASNSFLADTGRKQALGNFVKFVTEQHRMALLNGRGGFTNGLGMDITDKEYWEYVRPQVEFPNLLKSQEFLNAMGNPATYRRGVELIDEQNTQLPRDQRWIVFPFRAQFIQSFDRTTYGRLLVLVPNIPLADGSLLDRWIAFAIATPDLKPIPNVRSVSVIATIRDPKRPGANHGFFADFVRQRDPTTGKISINSTFLASPSPSKNCFDCHKTAVLPIHPKAAYKFDSGGNLVETPADQSPIPRALNSLMMSYGRSDFGHIDPSAFGPSLGQGATDRSDTFIFDATTDLPISSASYGAILSNMNCYQCHAKFASINYIIGIRTKEDLSTFESKNGLVQTYIEKGYMPPGNTLNPQERHALWKCIMKEYFDSRTGQGTFVDWLKGKGGP